MFKRFVTLCITIVVMGLYSFYLSGMRLSIETQSGEAILNQDPEVITCPKCNEENILTAMETLRCKHQICQACFLKIIRCARTDRTVTLCCPTCKAPFFSCDTHEESKAPQEPEYDSERDEENEEGFRSLLMGLMMNFVDAL